MEPAPALPALFLLFDLFVHLAILLALLLDLVGNDVLLEMGQELAIGGDGAEAALGVVANLGVGVDAAGLDERDDLLTGQLLRDTLAFFVFECPVPQVGLRLLRGRLRRTPMRGPDRLVGVLGFAARRSSRGASWSTSRLAVPDPCKKLRRSWASSNASMSAMTSAQVA